VLCQTDSTDVQRLDPHSKDVANGCRYSFHLLLKDDVLEPGVNNEYEQVPMSFIAVFEMMFGAFDLMYRICISIHFVCSDSS
jgi:hypothetical protein